MKNNFLNDIIPNLKYYLMAKIIVRVMTESGKIDFGSAVEISFVVGDFKTSVFVPFYQYSSEKGCINFAGEEDHTFEINKNSDLSKPLSF